MKSISEWKQDQLAKYLEAVDDSVGGGEVGVAGTPPTGMAAPDIQHGIGTDVSRGERALGMKDLIYKAGPYGVVITEMILKLLQTVQYNPNLIRRIADILHKGAREAILETVPEDQQKEALSKLLNPNLIRVYLNLAARRLKMELPEKAPAPSVAPEATPEGMPGGVGGGKYVPSEYTG